jgi:hypothetical protein
MKTPFTGGCICGAVRYRCTAKAKEIEMFRCHCRDCQHITGGAYAPVVYVPAATFKVTKGRIKHHFTKSLMMGKHRRGYCAQCGCRLTGGESEGGSPGIGVVAGSLDDPSGFKAKYDICVADAQPWDRLDPKTKHFQKFPPKG